MPQPFVLCLFCKNLKTGTRTCIAYPNGIPNEIWDNEVDHRDSYIGDNGIQFISLEVILEEF